MEEENFTQQELFEQKKYISDLVEESTSKNKSSLNIIFGSSIITSIIVPVSYTHLTLPTKA